MPKVAISRRVSGPAWRAYEEAMPAGLTIRDVLSFERDYLGNDLAEYNVPEGTLDRPAKEFIWLCRCREDAKHYLQEGDGLWDLSEYYLWDAIVVAEDQDGGILVEKKISFC